MMTIKAIVFDIGGVLEFTPDLGVDAKWEQKLNLKPGELNERLHEVWGSGGIGTITIEQVYTRIGESMRWNSAPVHEYMQDIWREYLGTLNVDLADYFRSLRPKYQTAIISNSLARASPIRASLP